MLLKDKYALNTFRKEKNKRNRTPGEMSMELFNSPHAFFPLPQSHLRMVIPLLETEGRRFKVEGTPSLPPK